MSASRVAATDAETGRRSLFPFIDGPANKANALAVAKREQTASFAYQQGRLT
jgi:hypothetical protein